MTIVLSSPFIRRLSAPHLPCNHVSNTLLCPTLCYLAEYINVKPNHHTSVMKNISLSYVSVSSFLRLHDFGAMQISDDAMETTGFGNYFQSKLCLDSAEKQASNEEVQLDVYHHSPECPSYHPGRQRRRKRKHGNQGRIPWNKGRTHSAGNSRLYKLNSLL